MGASRGSMTTSVYLRNNSIHEATDYCGSNFDHVIHEDGKNNMIKSFQNMLSNYMDTDAIVYHFLNFDFTKYLS